MEYSYNRAVLVVAGSIKDAEDINALLARAQFKKRRSDCFLKQRFRSLMMTGTNSDKECDGEDMSMSVGDILVGTPLASRGIDLALDNEVFDFSCLAF
jgi:hypothetical protein